MKISLVLFLLITMSALDNNALLINSSCPPIPASRNVSLPFLWKVLNQSFIFVEDRQPTLLFHLTSRDFEEILHFHNVTVKSSDTRVVTLPHYTKLVQNLTQALNDFLKTNPSSNHSECSGLQSFQTGFAIETQQLGKSTVTFRTYYNSTTSPTDSKLLELSFSIIVLREQRVVEVIFRVIITTLVVVLTFCMGAELDTMLIWTYLKKPIAPLIGFGSQFVLMPLIAFGLSMVLPVPPAMGFGLLTIGCSPGGGSSNVWTLLLGGELNLSMTMTYLSSLAALGMMPMWIYLLGRFFIDTSQVAIPYLEITLQLLFVVIPVFLGIVLRLKFVNVAIKVTRLTRPLALVFILFVLTFGNYVQWYIFKLFYQNPLILCLGAMLPWLGFLGGALVAFLCRLPRPQVITIGLETGIQNIGVAILVLMYSMPQPDGQLGASMPLAVALFTPIPLYITYGVMKIRQRFCVKLENKEVDQEIVVISSETFADAQSAAGIKSKPENS